MDYGKFKYEQDKKQKEARKHQVHTRVKEVKFHANVGDHDFDTKVRHTRDFLEEGHRVKVSLFFRGRENAHAELGYEVFNRVLKACEDLASVEQLPQRMGRMLMMRLAPKPGLRQRPRSETPAASQPPVAPAPSGVRT